MFNFINKSEDVPSKRRLWACVKNITYKRHINIDKIIFIKHIFSKLIIGLIILLNIIYPKHINADNLILDNQNQKNQDILLNNKVFVITNYNSTPILNENINFINLNSLNFKKDKLAAQNENFKKLQLWVTAYSSSPDETDDDPFITANGSLTRDGIAATNILPFGTKIKIPKLFGDKIFTIEDRMHERKTNFVDIWMESKEKAIQFGIHYAEIIILEKEPEFAKK